MKNPRITKSEVQIIKDAQAGDQLAFNKLFYKYKGFVDKLLYAYIKDMDEAKDVTNIVFLKVYNKLSKFTDYDSFGGWLRILTNRTAIDYLRSIGNKETVMGEETVRLTGSTPQLDYVEDPVNRLTYERVLDEFDKFPEHMKNILMLYYVNNMTVVQISKALDVPIGTIKSILSRTRKQIKNQFKQL